MGTDIHGRIQTRSIRWAREGDDVVGEATTSDGRKLPIAGYGPYADAGEIEHDRNYLVFAILAGVRNGFGFAGVKTHTPLIPIDGPRGLPDDYDVIKDRDYSEFDSGVENPKVREIRYSDFEFGDHSQSWLTLTEILAWPHWNDTLHRVGILDRAEYERVIREGDTPNSWSGGIWGRDVIETTHQAILDGSAPEKWTHVRYEWESPLLDGAKTFYAWLKYLESKHAWALSNDPAAVRLVFGFDS